MIRKKQTLKDQDLASWIFLSKTRDAIFKNRIKELQKYNISAEQSSVLIVLEALDERATPAEISKWVFREPHSVSDFLKKMERDGFLIRVKDLDRKNMLRIKLTEKGYKAIPKVKKMESVHKIMSSLSKEEKRKLIVILKKLWNSSLEELGIDKRPIFPSSRQNTN